MTNPTTSITETIYFELDNLMLLNLVKRFVEGNYSTDLLTLWRDVTLYNSYYAPKLPEELLHYVTDEIRQGSRPVATFIPYLKELQKSKRYGAGLSKLASEVRSTWGAG